MKKLILPLLFGLSVLTGCGSSGGGVSTGSTLTGVVLKGPIDGATIHVLDSTGTILGSVGSTQGRFTLDAIDLPTSDQAIFIESQGGSYTDEATGNTISLGAGNGLMTVFTTADLASTMAANDVIALTPETTILAKLVKTMLDAGSTAGSAITMAKQRVQSQIIDGTNPVMSIAEDNLMLIGDLTTAVPANSSEALARNRAISFSYETNSLNLSPIQVFDLINARALDLQDGTLDGKENGVTPILLIDKNQASISLAAINQNTNFGLARLRLLNNTIQRLRDGQLSADEVSGLSELGFDATNFTQLSADNQAAASSTQTLLAANNLPAFNHLPILSDEDGNAADAAATYTLTASENVNVTINAPGTSWTTPMLRYNNNQLPPVIKAKRGDDMTLNLVNNLTSPTTIHWHGFKIPGAQDGGPDFPVANGSSKTYQFTMSQPAAPLWFHPHPDMKTGEQVYKGLVGLYLQSDSISQQLETNKQLPSGGFDIPLLIQDLRFSDPVNGTRNLVYMDSPMDAMGMLGGEILVNGAVLPQLGVETRQYRFRIYNTSNARTYDFTLSDGTLFKVVGTDGGLLNQPVEVDHIVLGPAERAEIVVDFSQYTVGDRIMLVSKAFNAGGMNSGGMSGGGMNGGGMGGGGMNGGGMAGAGMSSMNGTYLDIMRFDIATQVIDDVTLYTVLPNNADINTRLLSSDASKTRNFIMTAAMSNAGGGTPGMVFAINGKTFDMSRIDETITLSQGDTEIWSIQNLSMMAHPFHAHAIQWQVLDRNGVPASGIDLGWKDTVLVQPGEIVRIIGKFDPSINSGDYMYHCHILEHEDAGMMGTFQINP